METYVDREIRREKILVPKDMRVKEIIAKYGVSQTCAFAARKRGWLIKNYSRNQIVIDREHFNLSEKEKAVENRCKYPVPHDFL